MRTYFIEIAVVNCAAKESGIELNGDYALYGTLKRFRDKTLGQVEIVQGIEDMQERAESFRFGVRCGKVLERYIDGFTPEQIRACEAKIARTFFAPNIAADAAVSTADKKAAMLMVLKASMKRAQIRTHTTKPGYEDISTWLDSYNNMQKEYSESLEDFVQAIVMPGNEDVKFADEFINSDDPLDKSRAFGQIISDILSVSA